MCKRLVIIGAGGHGKVIADIAVKCGYTDIAFLDDGKSGQCLGFPIVGGIAEINPLNDGHTEFFLAIGNNAVRQTLDEVHHVPWATLIHPSARIGLAATVGEGTAVMAGAVVNPDARIGRHCIINTGAVIEHDNRLGSYVHVSPNAALGGTVSVGDGTHIGIGAVIKNNVNICEKCTVGAGAVVVKTIDRSGVYVGVPAQYLETKK